MEKEGQPHSPEEIKQLLQDFPIYLGATNPDGSYRFPSIEKFQEQLQKMGIDFLSGDSSSQPKLVEAGDTKPESRQVEIPTTKAEAVAEAVEVEEAPTETVEEKPAEKVEETTTDDDEDFPEW